MPAKRSLLPLHMFTLVFLCTTFLLIPQHSLSDPVWDPWNGVPVHEGMDLNLDQRGIASRDGQTLVVWEEAEVFGPRLRAHLIAADHDTLWPGGCVVAEGADLYGSCRVLPSGEEEWLLMFSAQRRLRAQKLDANGELLWIEQGEEPEAGVPVYGDDSEYISPGLLRLLADGEGGLYVLFRAGSTLHPTREKIVLQRLGNDGSVYPGWPDEGIVQHDDGVSADMAPRGDDGVWVIYEQESTNGNVHHHFNGFDGNGASILEEPVQLNRYEPARLGIAADGDGGCYVAHPGDEPE
ncbi:hypothetical protein GF324_05030, partial [bacterium]|nr:hypothetical protein [bacterium]